jgi:hypothetical protein
VDTVPLYYKAFTDLDAAREALDIQGGWLLDLGAGTYLVTEDGAWVEGLRDADFLEQCRQQACWDETRH